MRLLSTLHFHRLIIPLCLTLFATRATAQGAASCFQLFFPVVQAEAGDTVCLPLMVRGADRIQEFSFRISWDTSSISLTTVKISESQLPNILPEMVYTNNPGKVFFSWDVANEGVSMPDSAQLFTLCFKLKTNAAGFYPVKIDHDIFTRVITNQDNGSFGLPMSQQGGGILAGMGQPSNLGIKTCISTPTCSFSTGSATTTGIGGAPPYQFVWSGPNGYSATGPEISNVTSGVYMVTMTDQSGATVSASCAVIDANPSISSYHQSANTTCHANNGCVLITVYQGSPPFSYSWPSSVIDSDNFNYTLAPGNYAVTISDANGCKRTENFSIYVGGEEAEAYISGSTIETCGGTGTLTVDSYSPMPYTYQWSTGDSTKTIEVAQPGYYYVTVTDPIGCSCIRNEYLGHAITDDWNLGLFTYCNPSSSSDGKVFLLTNDQSTLQSPCTITWSDGETHLWDGFDGSTILDSLVNVPPGAYSATITDSTGCTLTVESILDCAQMPPVPEGLPAFYIKDDYLNPQYDLDSCVGVYARNFNNIKELSFSIDWDYDNFKELRNLNLPGLTTDNFITDTLFKKIGVEWASTTPVTLPVESLLFEVCLTPMYNSGYRDVTFSDNPTDVKLVGEDDQELAFIGENGHVMYDLYFPLQPSACKFGVLPPNCSADGHSQVLLGQCNPGLQVDYIIISVSGAYSWGQVGKLLSLTPGKYEAFVTQAASQENNFYVKIPSKPPLPECVWPGDADNNGAVNHYDLLYLGMAYNEQGPPRTAPTLDWTGQDAPDWQQTTHLRHVNFKNIDANGDGLINAADTAAIVANWTRVVDITKDNPFGAPSTSNNPTVLPIISANSDTLTAGQAVMLPLSFGSANLPLDSIYGLAFTIAYDPKAVEDDVRFIPSNSWLGDSSQYLYIQKNFPSQGHLDVAITRKDGIPVSGWGSLGDLFIIIEDNIFDPLPLVSSDTTLKTMLYFNGLRATNGLEGAKNLQANPVELVIKRLASATKDVPAWAHNLSLYPNPATDLLHVESPDVAIEGIEITDLAGRVLARVVNVANSAAVSVQALPTGVYFIRISTEKGVLCRKFTIAR